MIRKNTTCCSCRTLLVAFASLVAAPYVDAATAAYAANQADGTVSVIDLARDEVTRTLPAHGKFGEKIQAIAVDAAEKTLFIVDAAGNSLLVVDVASGEVKKSIAVGRSPEGMSLSPSGKLAAVCVEDDDVVVLVDTRNLSISKRIVLQGKNPEHAIFSADEHWLVVSDENSDNVDVVDVAAGKSIALIASSGHPRGVGVLHKQPIAYVAQETAGVVDVIDLRTHKVTGTIATGLRPSGVTVGADDRRVFVSNGGDGNIAVIDTKQQRVVEKIPVGKRPWNMAITPEGKKLYVANGRSNSVSIIDAITLKSIREVAVGGLPWGVAIASH